jgi:predicted  nucleic acid-binding Zn-ribbon protein
MEQVELESEMQEALEDALNNLSEDIEIKLENYAKIIKNFESDIAGLKAEEERLAKKRKAMENSIKNMKQRMEQRQEYEKKLKEILTEDQYKKYQESRPQRRGFGRGPGRGGRRGGFGGQGGPRPQF